MTNQNETNICLNRSSSECEECSLDDHLDCHFRLRNLFLFFIGFVAFGVPVFMGMIFSGYGIFLIIWILYMIFFLQVWENRILCSHCPYYAGNGRMLRCHANYGLFKVWKYNPSPMTRWEQIQFLIGVGIFVGFPMPWLILGSQYVLFALAVVGAGVFLLILISKLCTRCVNFSCPLNLVPEGVVDKFLIRNPTMQKAWIKKRGK